MAPFSATIESEPPPDHTGPAFPAERAGGNSPKPGSRHDKPATPRQLALLVRVSNFVREHGFPPTMIELAAECGLTGNAIRDQLEALGRRGLVQRDTARSRGLRITPRGAAWLGDQPTPGTFVKLWRCADCGTARAGQGDCPECEREAGQT